MMSARSIAVVWPISPVTGRLVVIHGRLRNLHGGARTASTATEPGAFQFGEGPARLEAAIEDARLEPGPGATIVRVDAGTGSFSFFLRDLDVTGVIYVASCRAAIIRANDLRSYAQVEQALRATGQATGIASGISWMERAPEDTYEQAASQGRAMRLQAVLGLGRDARLFQLDVDRVSGAWGWIRPSNHGYPIFPKYPHVPDAARFEYSFVLGRGMGPQFETWRRLEDGTLPILRGGSGDGDVAYEVTAFVTLEKGPLVEQGVRGTPAVFAAGLAAGFNMSPAEAEAYERQRSQGAPEELEADNLSVLLLRAEAVNRSGVPRYAFFKSPGLVASRRWRPAIPERYEPETGYLAVLDDHCVATMTRLNGRPMPLSELSVLLPPGGRAVLDIVVPHIPVSRSRAEAMASIDFNARLDDARRHWRGKLASAAQLSLPERHIEERIKAGLLQLDMVTYGRSDERPLCVPAGMYYPPIGTESLPLISFYDSMGWHDAAARGLEFFLQRQREDGLIQVYGHYMSETSAVLFGLAEHYRYTRDDAWVKLILPGLIRTCEFVRRWRKRNQRPELRGRGYGMLDGAVADERDPTPYFFNSGYGCAGLRGAAAMLARLDPTRSRELEAEADLFAADIRAELAESMARSPVAPLSDGSWCPSAPPWAGHLGPLILFAQPRTAYTHNAFTTQDSLVGPLWLIYQGILAPEEPLAESLLQVHHDLMTVKNVAFCQQYYSRHDYAHLRRGEAASFLRNYYHSLSLADPEIYSFWEHYCMNEAGAYKTHEQAWFLMQSRWMLYLEHGETLRLLPGVPRAWLEDGKVIAVDGMVSHFGPIRLRVESNVSQGRITAHIECMSVERAGHGPAAVEVRLPHPDGRRARRASGGRYVPERECVVVEGFPGAADVGVEF